MKTGSFFTALVIVLLVAFLPGARAEDRPLARQGVLDLRGWDFKARGLVKLDGEWEFIWNRLVPPRENDPGAGPRDWPGYIRVPRIWNGQTTAGQKLGGKGVGTYGLTIRLPQQNSIYALFIQEAGSAYDLYLDGRLLARVGFPGETKETSRPAYKPMLVKFHPRGEETRLTILVSNFHQNMGGLWEPLLLGLEEQLADHRMIKTGLDFFLFGAILIMGLYHLGLFLLRKTEPAALYFSGFCLLMSLRVLVTGERHLLELVPGLPWSVLLKLEFLTFYLGGGALAGFIHHLYRDEFKKTVQVLIQAVSLFSSAVVILFPATVYTPLAPLSRALTPAILLYFLGVLVLAAKRKRPGAGTLLLGFLIFLASMVNDLLYAGQMIKTLYLFHFGMAGLVLAQAHVLTQKFVSAFSLVEQQHRDLELSNKALRDSRRKFQNLAELLPGAVFETDREGLVSFANRAATEMFGLKRPVRSREFNVLEAVPESGRAALENQLARLRETGNRMELEFTGLKADGSEFPVMAVLGPILDGAGQMAGIRGVALDVTRRKELEVRLRQAEKMEAMGTLAGGIAHDFNNILAAIIGYSELMLQDMPEEGQQRSDLEAIYQAGIRARELVKQILNYSRRTESGMKPVNLEPVVRESLRLLQATIPTTVEIKSHIQEKTRIVRADPTQIQQLILNLVKNGADEMRDHGGVLTLILEDRPGPPPASAGSPARTEQGEYLCLTVGDTGKGIAPEYMDRIFDPFFTTKEVGTGTGLGLSVVQGIVERHNGFMEVESEPGQGTVFTVWLPAFDGEYSEESFLEEQTPVAGSGRIMFVDDEEILVSFHEQMLKKLGYEVTAVSSSLRALEVFREDPYIFDLVITDYAMPRMTGTELAAEMLKRRPDLPIVLCTGYSERIDDAGARAMGLAGLILKPVSITDLSRIIRELLG